MFNRFVLTTTLILAGLIAVTTAQQRSCQNDGVIVGQDRHPKCQCSPGFKGYDCSLRVTPCEASPCRNEGSCSENRDGTFTCNCTALYNGILCEHRVRPCDSGPCKNGGNCTDDGINCFQCECPPGFKGSDCSEIVQPCEIKPCKNNGVCVNKKGGKFTCKCKEGFGGTFCDRRDGLYGSEILNQQQNYIVQLEKWIGGAKSWKLCYRATDNGWASSTFHSRCDSKKPTVTIIRSGSYIFGAYSDVAFGGSSGYRTSSNAFIFSFVNKDNLSPFKSPVYRNSGNALYTSSSYGPTFGAGHDIYIANNANANTGSYANLGHAYRPPSGYSYTSTKTRNLLAGTRNFTPNEVETFYFN
ncbi:Sushi, von Willebrand factor type A, EGF and pentraxin domain-containing 1 [Paramuricea clavata]|uniref:Sushi, von Willebrand factor type A, EGF and pentraxin domain-containing 1 n=1 Tax=Paramuricea clavata TaxID=317549 RepID=A0A7D9LBD0_PARCT|nr:Sushi, von Willebrand factor type A, EGF and pentraxin domain-containing 1 [Paramuricea clavata]